MKITCNRFVWVCLCAALAAAALLSVPAFAVTAVWDGGGTNNNWSTAENWEGDAVPQPADDLSVHLPITAARYTSVANLANPITLNRLNISNASYSVSGNTLRFVGTDPRILVGPGGHGFGFSCPLELAGSLTLEMRQSYNFAIRHGQRARLVHRHRRRRFGIGPFLPGGHLHRPHSDCRLLLAQQHGRASGRFHGRGHHHVRFAVAGLGCERRGDQPH